MSDQLFVLTLRQLFPQLAIGHLERFELSLPLHDLSDFFVNFRFEFRLVIQFGPDFLEFLQGYLVIQGRAVFLDLLGVLNLLLNRSEHLEVRVLSQ